MSGSGGERSPLLIKIHTNSSYDKITAAVAIPESSLKIAAEKIQGMARFASQAREIDDLRAELSRSRRNASAKFNVWKEDAQAVLPVPLRSSLQQGGESFLIRNVGSIMPNFEESARLPALCQRWAHMNEDPEKNKVFSELRVFSNDKMDSTTTDMHMLALWLMVEMRHAALGSYSGDPWYSENAGGSGVEIGGLVKGSAISGEQYVFEIDLSEPTIILVETTYGTRFYDCVSASDADVVLAPGASAGFQTALKRVITAAVESSQGPAPGDGMAMVEALQKQAKEFQTALEVTDSFIGNSEVLTTEMEKAGSLADALKTAEKSIDDTRAEIASLRDSIRQLESEANGSTDGK
jgi:hypothetical protein